MHNLLGIKSERILAINQLYNNLGILVIGSLLCFMKNLALGHAFNAKDLFKNFNINSIKITPEEVKKIYSDGNKRDLCSQIFSKALEIVVEDIIENNVHFQLPTLGRSKADLYMRRTSGEDFIKARNNGKWEDVDFVNSFFSAYQLCLRMYGNKRSERSKPIYLNKQLSDKITKHTNEGKQY